MGNYKIVPPYSWLTAVEITVVQRLNSVTLGKSGSVTNVNFTPTETWVTTTVEKGYFEVGQKVELYNLSGVKVGEATISKIYVGNGLLLRAVLQFPPTGPFGSIWIRDFMIRQRISLPLH